MEEDEDFGRLVARSSPGTPEAVARRAETPDDRHYVTAAAVLARRTEEFMAAALAQDGYRPLYEAAAAVCADDPFFDEELSAEDRDAWVREVVLREIAGWAAAGAEELS